MSKSQKNFRLSDEAQTLLESISERQKINETQVVEYCVGRYAAALGIQTDRAASVMLRQIAISVAANSGGRKLPLRPGVAAVPPPTSQAIPPAHKSRQRKVP